MLSKEEKLRYAQDLRQQIKEKQQKKKNQDRARRVGNRPLQTQSDRTLVPDPNIFTDKEVFQQRLQEQEYNPFGRAGGGAPSLKVPNHNPATVEHNPSFLAQQNSGIQSYARGQEYPPNQSSAPYLASQEALNYQPTVGVLPRSIGPQSVETGQRNYDPRLAQQQAIQYPPSPQRGYQEIPQRSYQQHPQRSQAYQGNSRVQVQEYQPTIIERQMIGPSQLQPRRQRIKTVENEEIHDVYKKGGRNLLRLENETMNEHLVKQKQKQEMQAFLKQQMEEAEMRKQEQKDRNKREELEEEKRNKQYIQRQNQKMKDEQMKKNQQRDKIAQDNLRHLQRRKEEDQMAKQRVERDRSQQHMKHQLQVQRQREAELAKQQVHVQRRTEIPRNQSSSSVSQTSSEQSYSKGFNTNISRDFVKKQRARDVERNKHDKKLQLFTGQIQKMKDEIVNQGGVFQRELDQIKRQAENANSEKRRAELEIERLKLQLEQKNKQQEFRLLQALKRNNPFPQRLPPQEQKQQHAKSYQYDSLNQLQQEDDDYNDRRPYGIPSKPTPSPPRPMAKNKRIYEHSEQAQQVKMPPRPARRAMDWQKQFKLEESNVGTLDADSKKIPMNIQSGTKLSMSGIQNLGPQGFNYGKSSSQSRAFRDEPKGSRASKRSDKDELDKLVQNKWQMSTVRDDITKEIEELLKKKDNANLKPSTVGGNSRLNQSRGAIPYEGPALNTLNSNKASLVSDGGTFDIDRLHGRNQARLRELRALGVQTINTANDDDLNRLNVLLNNY